MMRKKETFKEKIIIFFSTNDGYHTNLRTTIILSGMCEKVHE